MVRDWTVFMTLCRHRTIHHTVACASAFLPTTWALGEPPTPTCGSLPTTWVQVNGAYTDEPQYIDAGEPFNAPPNYGISFLNAFSSAVTGNGDIIYLIPSPYGNRLGRLTTTKQWQVWTDAGWQNDLDLAPRIIENTVLFYSNPKLYPHPSHPNGFLGVSNASVHSGGTGFDFHNFRASFEFDGEKFSQWTGGMAQDLFYAKQLIPARVGDPVDFAYDPSTHTGIAVGGYGSDGIYDAAKFTAVRFDLNSEAQQWHRWERSSVLDLGHWHTDDDTWPLSSEPCPDCARHVNVLDWNTPLRTTQTDAKVTRIPSASTVRYLATFFQEGVSPNVIAAVRYIDIPTPQWQWWRDGSWRTGTANPEHPELPFDYSAVTPTRVALQVPWYNGRVVLLYKNSNDTGLNEIIYDDTTETFSTPMSITTDFLLRPNYYNNSPFAVGVDADKTMWLAYAKYNNITQQSEIAILKRQAGQTAWSPAGTFITPTFSVPVGINFTNGGCLPVIFVEQTLFYPDPTINPNEQRLYAISPNVSYWIGESVLAVAPPPAPTMLNASNLTYAGQTLNETLVVNNAPYIAKTPGNIAVDADGYVYGTHLGWQACTVHSPGSTSPGENVSWGYSWETLHYAQGVAVDRPREKVYIAHQYNLGSESDIEAMSNTGAVSMWSTKYHGKNSAICYGTCGNCVPPDGFTDPRCDGSEQMLYVGLGWASDVAVDEAHGLLYVAEGMACMIHVYQINTVNPDVPPTYVYSFGSRGSGPGQFMFVKGIDVDASGNVFAVDCGNSRIQKWMRNTTTGRVDGTPPFTWGAPGRGTSQFINPVGLDVDANMDLVYVTDPVNHRVQIFDTSGTFKFQFSKYLDSSNDVQQLWGLGGVGSDDAGAVFLGVNGSLVRFLHQP